MSVTLRQARVVESAWREVALPWLKNHGNCALEHPERPFWVIADHAAQSLFLKHRSLGEGIASVGLQWLTAAGLRRTLAQHLGLSVAPLGRENLELLIRLEAARGSSLLARSLAAAPGDALRALDELGRTGWVDESTADLLPPELEGLRRVLVDSGGWVPQIEQQIATAASAITNPQGAALVFYWGGDHFPDLSLLRSLAAVVADLTIVVPQPRFLDEEDIDAEWINTLESIFSSPADVCAEPDDWTCLHGDFVHSLIMRERQDPGDVPLVRVGDNEAAQAALVVEWLCSLNPNDLQGRPIACLIPSEGGALLGLTSALESMGLPYHQEIGESSALGSFHTFQTFMVAYFSRRGDVDAALEWFEWLVARDEPVVRGLSVDKLRDHCKRAFSDCISREFNKLVALDLGGDEVSGGRDCFPMLLSLQEHLEVWPDEISWADAKTRWSRACRVFGFGTDYLEPVWSRLDALLSDRSMPSRYFFEYIQSLLASPGQWRPAPAVRPGCRLVITTPEAASGRVWGALAWLDVQDGAWPAPIIDHPFLIDSQRAALNRARPSNSSRLVLLRDRSARKRQMVYDLIENCAGPVLLAGRAFDGRDGDNETFPNEWAAQAILAGSGGGWSSRPAPELPLITRADPEMAGDTEYLKPVWDKEYFTMAHGSRNDPSTAPGPWEFTFDPSAERPKAINASVAEKFLQFPATVGLRRVFGTERRAADDFFRKEPVLLGTWVHRHLAEYLRLHIGKSISAVVDGLPDFTARSAMPSGPWTDVMAHYISTTARACLQDLADQRGDWVIEFVEHEMIPATTSTSLGPLALHGRCDLLLRGVEKMGCIVDFKTGSTGGVPSSAKLASLGLGLQYICYLILGRDQGYEQVMVVRPGAAKPERILEAAEVVAAEPHLALLARMTREACYPLRGDLRSDYGQGSESLPMTTVPPSAAVRLAKWQIFCEAAAHSVEEAS